MAAAMKAKLAKMVTAVESKEQWDELMAGLNGRLLVVDVHKQWCGPCTVMRPMMASHGRINIERLKKRQRYGSLELVNAIETYLSVYSREAWECHASLFDDAVLHEGRQAVGWGYDRCYHPHCHHATGGQALVTTMVVAHVGGWGGLSHRHGLAKQARGQQRRLPPADRAAVGHDDRGRHVVPQRTAVSVPPSPEVDETRPHHQRPLLHRHRITRSRIRGCQDT